MRDVWTRLAVLGAFLVVGCVGPTVEEPQPLESPVVPKKKASAKTPTAPIAPAPPPATDTSNTDTDTDSRTPLPPPAAADKVWVGRLERTAPVTFGGPHEGNNFCTYTVVFTDVTVKMTLDPDKKVKSSVVSGNMVESTTADCPHKPLGSKPQAFSFVPVADPAANLNINYGGAPANAPKSDLSLAGTSEGVERIKAKLKWRRTDIGAPFDWTVNGDVLLSPE